MRSKILEKELKALEFTNSLVKKLNDNNINILKDVWILKRKDLKDIGLSDIEINELVIKLQLNGYDLNKGSLSSSVGGTKN